jgi:hypothetical protein
MAKINLGRVILGGLVAGIVINICEFLINGVIFAKQWAESLSSLGKAGDPTINQIIAFNIWGFAAGLALVWVYAAIRPRYGAGPKTAVTAGIIVWLLGYVLAAAGPVILNLFKADLAAMALVAQLVEVLIAAVAGAALYKEEATAPLQTSTARA